MSRCSLWMVEQVCSIFFAISATLESSPSKYPRVSACVGNSIGRGVLVHFSCVGGGPGGGGGLGGGAFLANCVGAGDGVGGGPDGVVVAVVWLVLWQRCNACRCGVVVDRRLGGGALNSNCGCGIACAGRGGGCNGGELGGGAT